MKILFNGIIHFDGTTLAMELHQLNDADTGEALCGTHGDTAEAKIIARLRAAGIDTYDRRHKNPESAPVRPKSMFERVFSHEPGATGATGSVDPHYHGTIIHPDTTAGPEPRSGLFGTPAPEIIL